VSRPEHWGPCGCVCVTVARLGLDVNPLPGGGYYASMRSWDLWAGGPVKAAEVLGLRSGFDPPDLDRRGELLMGSESAGNLGDASLAPHHP